MSKSPLQQLANGFGGEPKAELAALRARAPRFPTPEGAVPLGKHGEAELFWRNNNGVPEVDWVDEWNVSERWTSFGISIDPLRNRAEAWRRARELGLPVEPRTGVEACVLAAWEGGHAQAIAQVIVAVERSFNNHEAAWRHRTSVVSTIRNCGPLAQPVELMVEPADAEALRRTCHEQSDMICKHLAEIKRLEELMLAPLVDVVRLRRESFEQGRQEGREQTIKAVDGVNSDGRFGGADWCYKVNVIAAIRALDSQSKSETVETMTDVYADFDQCTVAGKPPEWFEQIAARLRKAEGEGKI